jgi:hypothetical protein
MLPQIGAIGARCDQYIDGSRATELANLGHCHLEAAANDLDARHVRILGRQVLKKVFDSM